MTNKFDYLKHLGIDPLSPNEADQAIMTAWSEVGAANIAQTATLKKVKAAGKSGLEVPQPLLAEAEEGRKRCGRANVNLFGAIARAGR